MIKVLKDALGAIIRKHSTKKAKPAAALKRPNSGGNFRAVEIVPSIMCCPAATQAVGRSYLMREAPRLPLRGCTMAINCSCKFRKNADRRDGDRRLFGATETNRWFAGLDSRKHGSRRSSENR